MNKLRLYSWIEFAIWLIVLAVLLFGVKFHSQNSHKKYRNYQIFVSDADGLIVGSPVRYTGVQIGYVNKIQIISSNVYIRFLVTEKDFELPTGAIATVEGSGLGGSKSIEIYPPDPNVESEKIIETKDPIRLNKVMGLFKNMFKELDEIITTISNASVKIKDTEHNSKIEDVDFEEINTTDADNEEEEILEKTAGTLKKQKLNIDLNKLDKQLDSATEKARKLNKSLKKIKNNTPVKEEKEEEGNDLIKPES